MTSTDPHAELRAMYEAMVAASGDRDEVSRTFEFLPTYSSDWIRFDGGDIAWVPEFDYRYNPLINANDIAMQTPAYLHTVIKNLRERNEDLQTRLAKAERLAESLNALLRDQEALAQYWPNKLNDTDAELATCQEDLHIAERRLENLQESYAELQEENERIRADRDDVKREADRIVDHTAELRDQRNALSAKLNVIHDFIESD